MRRTSSRVNISRVYSGQRERCADADVPHADGENDQERREREIARRLTTSHDDHDEQERRRRNEREIETKEERKRVQMTLCSLMSSPRANRS